jgi:2-keto-3-deoxy-L-fuconate dehydrogenase
MFNLKDKKAIVTGGASGIGLAIVKLFLQQGAEVHILDYNMPNNPHELLSQNLDHLYLHQCDVSHQSSVKTIIDKVAENKSIDILINNAGVAHIGNIEDTSEQDMDRIYNINVKGYYNTMLAAIPHMVEKGGSILNIASVAATVGINNRFAYSMSKGAVISMTLSIAKDYIKHNIRCNSISPGRVHTPFVDGFIAKNYPGQEKEMFEKLSKTQPIGRMAQPDEIAHIALYLCSDEAAFITGTDYPIDGGFIKLNGN